MLKTVCIKTTNQEIIKYLLNELEYLEMEDIYISCRKFKIYTNLIIHYVGKETQNFLKKISNIFACMTIDMYEEKIIKNLINTNYFYFSTEEKRKIYEICLNNIDLKSAILRLKKITEAFNEYFKHNRYAIIDGFVSFKIKEYIHELDSWVDMSVNQFIVDREYKEFIEILKTYIQTEKSKIKEIHLIYKNNNPVLLDDKKRVIKLNEETLKSKYLSDITFSSNDVALNALLTLLPEKLYIHILDREDEFINTLKSIFEKKAFICTECDICNIYKNKRINKKISMKKV